MTEDIRDALLHEPKERDSLSESILSGGADEALPMWEPVDLQGTMQAEEIMREKFLWRGRGQWTDLSITPYRLILETVRIKYYFFATPSEDANAYWQLLVALVNLVIGIFTLYSPKSYEITSVELPIVKWATAAIGVSRRPSMTSHASRITLFLSIAVMIPSTISFQSQSFGSLVIIGWISIAIGVLSLLILGFTLRRVQQTRKVGKGLSWTFITAVVEFLMAMTVMSIGIWLAVATPKVTQCDYDDDGMPEDCTCNGTLYPNVEVTTSQDSISCGFPGVSKVFVVCGWFLTFFCALLIRFAQFDQEVLHWIRFEGVTGYLYRDDALTARKMIREYSHWDKHQK